MFQILFILCRDINKTNFDETLLLAIFSKFKLTSLVVGFGNRDEYIFMRLLQMSPIQETLEDFTIYDLDISECTSVVELLVEFESIKTIKIVFYFNDDDKLEEWKLKIEQFEKIMKKKHSEIYIDINYQYINH